MRTEQLKNVYVLVAKKTNPMVRFLLNSVSRRSCIADCTSGVKKEKYGKKRLVLEGANRSTTGCSIYRYQPFSEPLPAVRRTAIVRSANR